MGWLVQSAVCLPLLVTADFAVVEALVAFFPALAFFFFGLLAGAFLTFFMLLVATLRAAFFGLPLEFVFFFFTVLLLSSTHLRVLRGPFLRGERRELTDAKTSSIAGNRPWWPDCQIPDRCEFWQTYIQPEWLCPA